MAHERERRKEFFRARTDGRKIYLGSGYPRFFGARGPSPRPWCAAWKRLRRFSAVAASLLLLCAVGVFIFGDPLGSGRNAGFQDGAGCMTDEGYSSVAVGSDGGSGETNGASEPDASEESAEEDGETSSSV